MSGDEQALREGLPTGTELGEYVIEAAIGQGGFGVVYRAKHKYLGTVVALKEYLPATVAVRTGGRVRPRSQAVAADYEEGLQRFIEEARHLVQFRSHPGIVTCVGFFEECGTAYLAMEHEDGLPLSELLTRREAAGRPLDEAELLRLAKQVLESLAAVHQAAVLHRDIKPSNILIRRSDDRPVLIDFGAAKEDFVRYTKSSAPHTQGYAAIEQMEADGKLGPWTDLYGLGAVLWRIVAGGHPPYEPLVPVDPLSRMAARFRGQEDPLPSARKLGAGRFSPAVLNAIDKCLELEPPDRPANCEELLRRLSVLVRKDLVESRPANVGRGESGREERGSREEAEPLPEVTLERGDSQQSSLSERWGVAFWTMVIALSVVVLPLVVLLGGRGGSSENIALEDRQQDRVELAPDEKPTPRPSTVEADSMAVSQDLVAHDRQRLGRLTVNTEPTGARVRLLDEAGEYRAGMELESGEYRVEVSAEGYETHVAKVRHGAGSTEFRVELTPSAPVAAELSGSPKSPVGTDIDTGGVLQPSIPEIVPYGSASPRVHTSEVRNPTSSAPLTPPTALTRALTVPPTPKNIPRNRVSRLQRKDSDSLESAYFTRGSHRDDVLRIQGTPSSIDRYSNHEVWRYGLSTVEISTRDGRVREWSNSGGRLKVRLDPGPNVTSAQTFTRGSHRDDVLRIHGTPWSIDEYSDHEVWRYGLSTVEISTRDGRVMEWSNSGRTLKVKLEPGPNVTGAKTFTRGSHRDDVLRIQGTPSSIDGYSDHEVWRYGLSTVEISTRDGRVMEWSNSGRTLKVRLEPGPNVTGAKTFTRGSHRSDVLRLQGTPDSVNLYPSLAKEVLRYGLSTVEISTRDGRVTDWANLSGNLNVR